MAYAFGQLLNGQLAEHFSPRKLLAWGMLGSAALNVLFGFSTGLYFLIFVWACNGYCQSLGWTPCVRVLGNWIPILRRGRAIGIVGTGYLTPRWTRMEQMMPSGSRHFPRRGMMEDGWSKTRFSSNGQRIYYTATSNSKKAIKANMDSMSISNPMISFVSCHC